MCENINYENKRSKPRGQANRNAAKLLMVIVSFMGVWHMLSGVYIHVKAEFAQMLLEESWKKTLLGQKRYKPWPWADTWPVARMVVPKLNLDFIILEGGTGRTLAFAPGHLSGSVQPGENGVSVIGGHRDTHFAFLQKMKLGDALYVENAQGKREHYVIQQVDIADIRDSEILLDAEEPIIALVACYPFYAIEPGGPLRYVVVAGQVANNWSLSLQDDLSLGDRLTDNAAHEKVLMQSHFGLKY